VTATDIATALRAALALGSEGRPCFPCRANKRPATPHGFKEATCDANGLCGLWRHYPGPLVGLVTGEASGIDVLDLDKGHPEAGVWWAENRHRIPETRTHRTRSGGLHLLFRHTSALRCTAGRIAPGIDTRGDGGYLIWWPAAGFPVLRDLSPVSWPAWLFDTLAQPPATSRGRRSSFCIGTGQYAPTALRNAAHRVVTAKPGRRNNVLNAEAYRIGRFVEAGLLDAQEVADTLADSAFTAGLDPREIVATLHSAFRARDLL
jgi:bifunctional DNA primase/polymerase-like protein